MGWRDKIEQRGESVGFNMTAIIDIVFLLIIFFLIVCQFIDAENFQIRVPDKCDNAASTDPGGQVVTLTIMKTDDKVEFAVGGEKISGNDRMALTEHLRVLIDHQMGHLPAESKIVNLRIDRDVSYEDAQYALAAVSQSQAGKIELASVRGELPE